MRAQAAQAGSKVHFLCDVLNLFCPRGLKTEIDSLIQRSPPYTEILLMI